MEGPESSDALGTELLEIAVAGAKGAGELLLDRFRGPASGVDTKTSPTDLVSDADRDSERWLIAHITDHRGGDGIVGEEGGGKASSTGIEWIVDPLDGTVNFLFGIPVWGVSVAVEDEHGGLIGVVHDPNRGETFVARRSHGARLGERALRVSQATDLSEALVATGFAYDPEIRASQARVVARVLPQVRDIRRAGSAALDLCALAAGRVDAFYEAHLERWDRAAGELIAREAGALVTDLSPPKGSSTGVVAANPGLHPAVSELVQHDR